MYKEDQIFLLSSIRSVRYICFLYLVIPVLCGLGARPLLIFRNLVTILFCCSEHYIIVIVAIIVGSLNSCDC
jgi:hypothetical protein